MHMISSKHARGAGGLLRNLQISHLRCEVERCVPRSDLCINLMAVRKKMPGGVNVSGTSSKMQRRPAFILHFRAGAAPFGSRRTAASPKRVNTALPSLQTHAVDPALERPHNSR